MNIREMDELYTKFLVVTGLPAEKILDLFLAGYTLVSPAPPICLEVLAEGFDIEREYTRLKNEMQDVKAENRRWGQVCEAQNKRIGQLEKERDEAEREAAQYKAFFDGVANTVSVILGLSAFGGATGSVTAFSKGLSVSSIS